MMRKEAAIAADNKNKNNRDDDPARLICTGGLWKFGDGAHGAAADDQADAGVDDDDQGEEKTAPRDDH
ncbi:unnamed protein product [Sphagnum jensenii]